MTTDTDAHTHSIERHKVLGQANKQWRRIGVRRADRKALLAELDTELHGAHQDGHSMTSVLGEDSAQMLRAWAHEREMTGRAWRLELVVPAAFLGIGTGLAVVLVVLYAAFSGRSTTFDPGPFVLPFYASAGLLGYLCALLCVGGVLRGSGDPHASSTVRWLAALLPLGTAACIGAGVAVAWWRNFSTTPPVFIAVIGVVVIGLGLTIGLSRYFAVNEPNNDENDFVGIGSAAIPTAVDPGERSP